MSWLVLMWPDEEGTKQNLPDRARRTLTVMSCSYDVSKCAVKVMYRYAANWSSRTIALQLILFLIHPIIITYHFKLLGFGFPKRNPNKKVFTQNLSGHSGLRLNLIVYNIDGWAAMCVWSCSAMHTTLLLGKHYYHFINFYPPPAATLIILSHSSQTQIKEQ